MAALSDYLENKLLDALLRGQPFTMPATVNVALDTTVDNDGDSSKVEVSGGSYARVAVASSLANWAGTQAAASTVASSGTSATTSNNGVITFPTPTAAWGVITGFAVYDAPTGGNLLFYAALTTPKTVNNGDPAPSFAAGTLSLQLDT
jgi:hypothetical protein